MVKKAIFIIILIVLLGLFYGLGKQTYDSLQVSRRLDEETEELMQLQKKNLYLKKRLVEINTLKFIEAQARDKLNLARSGETVIVIPQKELDRVLGVENRQKIEKITNWQGWLKLFGIERVK